LIRPHKKGGIGLLCGIHPNGNANQIISIAQEVMGFYNQAVALNNAWNDDGSLTVIENLATCTVNADGSLGTADGNPNSANPIDTRTPANSALSRAVSAI
jgi:hypothetical protein